MTNLDRAWWAWRALSKREKEQFLARLREQYSRERAAAVRKNGRATHSAAVASLSDLTLTEFDVGATALE
jgi:hypothetical protein